MTDKGIGKVPLEPIVSDFDGKTYLYPKVYGQLEFSHDELITELESLGSLERGAYGLYGLQFPLKFVESTHLTRNSGFITLEDENDYFGLEWITNTNVSPVAIENGAKGARELKLEYKHRKWDDSCGYLGDLVFERFCIHPETGEFFGDKVGSGNHARSVGRYGSYPFTEYVRLTYTGHHREKGILDQGVLLSRPYYNPSDYNEPFDFDKNKELQVRVLALLIINGLPKDTQLGLSANRNVHQYYSIE